EQIRPAVIFDEQDAIAPRVPEQDRGHTFGPLPRRACRIASELVGMPARLEHQEDALGLGGQIEVGYGVGAQIGLATRTRSLERQPRTFAIQTNFEDRRSGLELARREEGLPRVLDGLTRLPRRGRN